MILSQNFLVDKYFISKFVSYIANERPLIEVGCGHGNISRFIHPDVCIEIDERFKDELKDYNLVIADGRKMPILRGQIVSSLPYSITEDFFNEIVQINEINRLVLILQKDFVDKIKFYSTFISFILNFYFDIILYDIIPPYSFSPKPKVFSIISIFNRKRRFNPIVNNALRCVSNYRNKKLKSAAKLCGLVSGEEKRVREYKPCQVLELLNSLGISYA
ncbi:16S ribosomal RNA methyltransferase A [Acidianus manzaensis]|uniref:16S rRNA (Adenine(1518)-N(6)/adenine(1519)-N(6))-dimethyltransferase n=1 Tax=Acidianus manzaensis TaxID=282676 RepID=A0A1W6K090_9CREN|nr:16S ribosomal RNA methyltransferase A [Acidianus manzaensis]ARM75902.1 16S rRNA (adenine(1518)-N(6)/adenine(1519)-N(6))-dimethyltransferase [Acidianus manzaensis]